MSVTATEVQVQWGGGNHTAAVAAGQNAQSDPFPVEADCVRAQVELKAQSSGSPEAGDTIDFHLMATLGDPDGAGGDEYESEQHATFLARLDTSRDEPAVSVVDLPLPLKGGKILAASGAAAAAITVSVCILQQRIS